MKKSFNGHIVQILTDNGHISTIVPFTGVFASRVLYVKNTDLQEYNELSRSEKAIEIRSRR